MNTWQYSRVAFSGEMPDVHCAITAVHPWSYDIGQKTDSGSYLSPVNAINWMAGKLAGMGEEAEVVILLVTGESEADFISRLGKIIDVMPLPSLAQIKRLAESSASLASERMIIPAPLSSGISTGAPLSFSTARTAICAQAVASAKKQIEAGTNMDAIKNAVASFEAMRDDAFKNIDNELDELKGKSAESWVFSGLGNVATMLVDMLKSIPLATSVHSAAIMFSGRDLEGIRGMIHEYQSNAGA